MRVVIDTNAWVSAIILPQSRTGALIPLLQDGLFTPLFHPATLTELLSVLSRPRIQNKYGVSMEDVQTIADLLLVNGETVERLHKFTVCRDPKDDIFLDIAASGDANAIVGGDADLLTLHPFRSIPIISPTEFLRNIS
jgi:uncharacterized protein